MMKNLFFVVSSLLFTPLAFAQTWDGSTSTDWNTPANWSTNAVPLATGNVIIPGSLTNYPVMANNVAINSIDMRAGSQLDFNGFNLATSGVNDYNYFIGATLNNSNAGTDIVINVTTSPGYHNYIRSSTVNDNFTFNMSGPANLYEADNTGTGNHYTGDVNFSAAGTGALYLSNTDTSRYDGNLTISRTAAGITDAFNSGAIIGGNFSFTNNTAGNSLFGIATRKTSIAGTINIAINNTTPGSFELIHVVNQTEGGNINVQNSTGFDIRNDTLTVNELSITGYRGADYGYLFNNDITGNVTFTDDASHVVGYHTYIRENIITGNAGFTINSTTNLYEADNTGTGNHYTGNVSFTAAGTGTFFISDTDTSRYDGNLTISRTVAGNTDAFSSGAIIGGNFSFTNNTAGNSLFGIAARKTSIAGTINIAINNTTSGNFELIHVVNQVGGGSIDVQNSTGFDIRNDTLTVNALSITGYRGADYGYLFNNDITGNVTFTDDATHGVGYHTYIRENIITGNAGFTINSPTNLYEADNTGTGNHYTGNVSFTAAGTGTFYISDTDTSRYDGNLTISRTVAGNTDAFSSGAIIGGNFSFTNNTAGNSLFGIAARKTSIAGTINIAINNTTSGNFELIHVVNQVGGGSIDVQNSTGFDIRNDTLLLSALSINGYRGADYGYLFNNDLTGNVTIADDATHVAGYHSYIRQNLITGDISFTNNGPGIFYDADNTGSGNKYKGNVSYIRNAGSISVGSSDTTEIGQNLTLNSAANITLTSIKFNGATDGIIEQLGTQPVVIPRLTMEKTGTGKITLDDAVTVSTSLFFNGGNIVSTPTNTLNFADNATHSGASDISHVNGYVSKTGNEAFSFPTGTASTLNAVSMTAPATAGSRFSAQYFQNNPANNGFDTSVRAATLQRVSGCEYWEVNREAGTDNVTLAFNFRNPCSPDPLYINDPSKLGIAHWTGSTWEDLGNGGSTGTTTGTVTTAGPVTNFSPFTFASVDIIANPLPIQLIKFIVSKNKDAADIQWQAANALNFSHFEVERSKNGSQFAKIGSINALNGAAVQQYSLRDEAPSSGINFYRLKMVDLDGKFKYSDIETILFDESAVITIFPNPVKNEFKILSSRNILSIEIMDLSGKIIKRLAAKANNRYNVSDLRRGIYLIRVRDKEESQVSRLLVE